MPTAERARHFAWEVALQVSVWGVISIIATSFIWIPAVIGTVRTITTNKDSIEVNAAAISELAVTLGGMGEIFGGANILENGQELTVIVNVHSDAGRYFQPGRRLTVTNTGDSREMSVTVEVAGKFEGEPHMFLNMTRAAGRAIGANPGDEIQVSIEPAQERRSD